MTSLSHLEYSDSGQNGSLNVVIWTISDGLLKVQASRSYESNLCFSKLSEKLPEITKNALDKNHDDFDAQTIGLSVNLTSHEQFNPNQVINLAVIPLLETLWTSQILIFSLKHC